MKLATDWARFTLFIGLVILLISNNIYYFYGHFGVDDMEYARLSYELLHGKYDWSNHYSYRLSILSFTALSYAILGVNDIASALPAIFLTLGILWLMFDLCKADKFSTLLITLGFYFCVKWNLFYADKLMPDIYVSAFVFLAWWAYNKTISNSNAHNKNALIFSTGLFLAFLSKGTVILVLPLFAFYFCKDLFARSNLNFWVSAIIAHVILYTIYFGLHGYITGDFLARFHAISANSYLNSCSYDQLPISETYHRLTQGFYQFISKENIIIFGIICLASICRLTSSNENSRFKFLLITSLICIVSANVMTISLTSYNPTCLDIRHYLLFLPILAYCSGQLLASANQIDNKVLFLILAFSIIQILFRVDDISIKELVPLLGLMLLSANTFIKNRITKTILYSISICSLIYPSLKQMSYSRSLGYSEVKSNYNDLLGQIPEDVEIYTSHVACNLGEYYLGFEGSSVTFKDIRKDTFTRNYQGSQILLKNWYCDWHSEVEENTYNEWSKYEDLTLKLDEKSNKIIRLYQIEK